VYGSANTGSIANNFYVYDNVASAVRMTVASTTGKVGIGTTTPAYKLDVAGAITGTSVLVNGVPVASSTDTYWSANGGGKISYNGGNVGIGTTTPTRLLSLSGSQSVISLYNSGTTTWTGLEMLANNGTLLAVIGLDDATGRYGINMKSDGTEDFTITQNGNVGIGTTTPAYKLQIQDATSPAIALQYSTNSDYPYLLSNSSNDLIIGSAGSGSHAVFKSTGNVGIGTTTPSNKLQIGPTTYSVNSLAMGNGTQNFAIDISARTIPTFFSDNNFSFMASGGGNGNVGIGTTAPASKLHVAGGTIRNDLGSSGVSLCLTGGGSNLQIYHNSGSSVYFWNTAGGDYEFYDAAGSTSTGTLKAGAFNTGSDRRLKNNIVNTHFGISDLMKIQVRDYVYKADTSKTLVTGFIAQELYEIFPNAVTKPANDDKMWSVDYGNVTPLLVKAIQDQQSTIVSLQNTVSTQQQQINELKILVQKLIEK